MFMHRIIRSIDRSIAKSLSANHQLLSLTDSAVDCMDVRDKAQAAYDKLAAGQDVWPMDRTHCLALARAQHRLDIANANAKLASQSLRLFLNTAKLPEAIH